MTNYSPGYGYPPQGRLPIEERRRAPGVVTAAVVLSLVVGVPLLIVAAIIGVTVFDGSGPLHPEDVALLVASLIPGLALLGSAVPVRRGNGAGRIVAVIGACLPLLGSVFLFIATVVVIGNANGANAAKAALVLTVLLVLMAACAGIVTLLFRPVANRYFAPPGRW
jgi:peptidoglycan/LPS O-acetylase OafA/YrhL